MIIKKQEAPTIIIDGDNLLHRAYWISKDKFINSKGVNTGVTYSGLRMTKGYVQQFGAKNIYVAWDKKLVTTPVTNYRKELLPEYKGNRLTVETKNNADAVHEQSDTFRDVLSSLGVRHIFPKILEADDVIGWLARKIEGKNIIISNDGDMLQLISENINVFNPFKKVTIALDNFEAIIGVAKENYLAYRAVKGDTSDNIPGVRGFGPKKAQKFAANRLIEARNLKPEQLEIFDRNIRLMDLSRSLEEEKDEEAVYLEQFNNIQNVKTDLEQFKKYCQDLEFPSILNQFNEYKLTFEK